MTVLPEAFLARPIAHRALHDIKDGRPENSRAAIEAAIAADFGIELDLQLSRDQRAMVFHDPTVDRLTAHSGQVSAFTSADLGRMTLCGGHDGVPTLDDVLTSVAGRVPLLIELKDQHGSLGKTDGALEQAVAAALASYTGSVAVMSFNPNMVAALAKLLPERPRGLVTSAFRKDDWPNLSTAARERLREIPDFDRAACSFVSHHATDLTRSRVVDLRAAGTPVLCWTIRSSSQEEAARQHSDNITFEGYIPA